MRLFRLEIKRVLKSRRTMILLAVAIVLSVLMAIVPIYYDSINRPNADGTVSLQILESSQIDMDNPVKKAMFLEGTHFNPVDLVCAIKDYKGNKFDLPKYIDKSTGFISSKSKGGRSLKALELPGLWNGAMSDWNTVFVEVPLSTFNPVKTVNDLLRDTHQ